MHLPTVLAASAATLAMAAPRPAGKTFRVTQVATGRKTHVNGPAEMMKIYNKRKHMKAPEGLSAAVAKEESGETGSVAGNPPNSNDNEYISPVTVGNDQVSLRNKVISGQQMLTIESSISNSTQEAVIFGASQTSRLQRCPRATTSTIQLQAL